MRRVLMLLFLSTAASNALADKILRIGISALPVAQGTPYSATNIPVSIPASALFDTLTILNDKGELEPWLAHEWWAEDELTWVFRLRDNVAFSNEPRRVFASPSAASCAPL